MSALKFLLAAAVLGYVAIAFVVYLLQDNLLFYPQPPLGKPVPPPRWQLEEIRVSARDGTPLEGVLVKPTALAGRAPLPLECRLVEVGIVEFRPVKQLVSRVLAGVGRAGL